VQLTDATAQASPALREAPPGYASATMATRRAEDLALPPPGPARAVSRACGRDHWLVWWLVVGGTLAVFWPILPELWRIWLDDPNNSHGALVPLVSVTLIWRKRQEILAAELRPTLWGFCLAALALGMYLAALRAQVAFPARIALVLAIVGFVWGNFGTAITRRLGFPLAFLGFMIPVPDTLEGLVAFPLQLVASAASAHLLRLAGIPVLREGNILYFADASLEVAEACSGIRSMVSYGIAGTLLAYLGRERLSGMRQATLVAATIPLALAVNIFRVAGTGVLATHMGTRAARGFLHEFSGFLVFAVGFLLLWGLSALLEQTGRSASPVPRGAHLPPRESA
jgi:exosortase